MKVTGIIAEYNPFHNGHAYHLSEARKLLGSDYVVVVMSGNYVQRGAPTIIDKYSRCEMALKCGADLVLELPACYSTASAEYFAYGGVSILDKLGVVNDLCFGTESLDEAVMGGVKAEVAAEKKSITDYFSAIADLIIEEPEEYRQALKEALKDGASSAAAQAAAVGKVLGPDYVKVLETSNNILGVEYMKAIKRLGSSIKPEPIARMLAAHTDSAIIDGFSSATAIRNAIFNAYDADSLSRTVPADAFEILMDKYLVSFPVFRDDFSTLLGSKLVLADKPSDLTCYFGVTEDLANRILNLKNQFRSFNQFRELVNCKSYTKATVGRALMHITLGIRQKDMDELTGLDAVKVLGFRKSAQPLLSRIKKNGSIKLVTKLADYEPAGDEASDAIEQTTRADMLYRMICMNKFDTDLKTPYEEEVRIIDA